MTPNDRKYTESHEWIKVDGSRATVGITDHAQEELGDITFVELPEAGKSLKQGDECGEIESVKAASDIYAPASGIVDQVNEALEDSPEKINSSAYEDGWIVKLKDVNTDEVEDLMAAEAYEEFLKEEG